MSSGKKPKTDSDTSAADIWSKENILNAARSTGKPFEVEAANQFLTAGWLPYLGTYYHDVTRDMAREIDIVASKELRADGIHFRIRACASCRGFPPDHRPVAYYVSRKAHPTFIPPRLPCQAFRFTFGWKDKVWDLRPDGTFHEEQAITSLDVYKINTKDGKEKLPIRSTGDGSMEGNRDSIYSALDSAIKAAIYWQQAEYSAHVKQQDAWGGRSSDAPPGRVLLYVPILVLSEDWIAIGVDKGQPSSVSEVPLGHMTVLYPFKGAEQPDAVTCIICSRQGLPQAINALGGLLQNAVDNARG